MKSFNKVCQCGCDTKFTTVTEKTRFIRGHYRKFQTGEKQPNWRGGETRSRGYVFVYTPDHPSHNMEFYVKRSRLEMEKSLGRYLKTNEIVHHINGIKDDDRIENLVLTTRSNHNVIHKTKH